MTSYTIAKLLSPVGIVIYLILGVFSFEYGFGQEFSTLFGFGLAGLVEIISLIVVMLKLMGSGPERILKREKWSTVIIGTLFLQLAFVVALVSFLKLTRSEGPGEVAPGLTIGLVVLGVTGVLYLILRRASLQNRSATISTAAHSFYTTIKLSLTLIITSWVKMQYPDLWWVDNFGAMFLAIQIGKEGLTLIRASRRQDFNR